MTTQNQINARITVVSIVAVILALGLWVTCTANASAQEPPTEPPTDTTSVLNTNGLAAESGQVADGLGLGGDPVPLPMGVHDIPADEMKDSFARLFGHYTESPTSFDWFEVWYGLDSRHVNLLTFKGHSRPAEFLDVYGHVDFESGVDQDAARFRARVDLSGVGKAPVGPITHLEDFSGSKNDHVRFGAYWTPWLGGSDPWVRFDALPVGTDGAGMMARANLEMALRKRWSVEGFGEHAWGDDAGDFTSVEIGPRYDFVPGRLFGTVIYRYDDRQDERDGFAFEIGAGL